MAKHKYEIATLSKANKDLALLIDEDLQKESELLQRLIKEVYEANQKVKESHAKRVQETQDKLKILNAEIENLSTDIDKKDQSTTLEQFNYLLQSKDDIFDALNTMRLFDSHHHLTQPLNTHMVLLKNRLLGLLHSEREKRTPLIQLYFDPVTDLLQAWINSMFEKTDAVLTSEAKNPNGLHTVFEHYTDLTPEIDTLFSTLNTAFETMLEQRTHILTQTNDDTTFNDKIDTMFEDTKHAITTQIQDTIEAYNTSIKTLDKQLDSTEKDTIEMLQNKYGTKIEGEESTQESLQDELKQLRFDIMSAEKKGDTNKMQELMKLYERKEKQSLGLFREKIKKIADKQTKKARLKLLKERKKIELNHQKDLHQLTIQLESENIKFSESRSLFKLKEDQKALENDKKVNQVWFQELKSFHFKLLTLKKHFIDFAKSLSNLIFDEQMQLTKLEIEQLDTFIPLKDKLKPLELELAREIREKAFDEQLFNVELTLAFKKMKGNIKHQQTLQQILKEKISKEKTLEVNTIRAQEDAKSELIYQHALIEIAEKEHELQLLKIQSLYDSEVDLTKSQAERLTIGIGVTETMVKTTVESQILFAKQQMKFAEKEYEARLENIDRAKQQELAYASQKLASFEQVYQYERIELEKNKDKKLEDLSYRIALFTGQKDQKMLKEQEDSIKAHFEDALTNLNAKEANDPQIIRYKKQINASIKRAEKAQEDAMKLKQKTIETFEELLSAGEVKLEAFTSKQDRQLVPYIESASSKTAKERLGEAIKEAEEYLNEKIEEPKQRIALLQETLKQLATKQSPDTDSLSEQIDQEMQRNAQHTAQAEQSAIEKTESIKLERTSFREKMETATQSLDQTTKIDKSALKNKLYQQLKEQKATIEQQFKTLKDELDHTHKSHLTTLNHTCQELNHQLDLTIRAFKRYLSSTTSSQNEKLRQMKKTLNDQLKHQLADINKQY